MSDSFMNVILTTVGLLAAMLGMLELGRRIGIRRRAADPEGTTAGVGAVDGAVFGLMGLLIAFTFSGAAARFDARRQLIVQETNAIGTAYLRLDLLPATTQADLRLRFREYVDARLAFFQHLHDPAAEKTIGERVQQLQVEIWRHAVSGAKETGSPAVVTLVLSSLNEMIDITTTRGVSLETHPPFVIYLMTAALVLTSSLLAGFGMAGGKQRSVLHMIGFAVILSVTLYVILDLEHPRLGLVRVDSVDHILVELRNSMNP